GIQSVPPDGVASGAGSLAAGSSAASPLSVSPPAADPWAANLSAGNLPADSMIRRLVRQDGSAKVHVLGRKTRIGRTPDNDVQIDAKLVSRHHAMILAGPGHTIIEDLNSTNGVLVNGRRIVRERLQDGDEIVLGSTHFRFELGGIR
ncbi:MAG: FHA domain-containing protein, partial [Steroidobacteraceae bacterium]